MGASLGVLNNVAALSAQNELLQTSKSLQTTLFRLSSGSRLNSGQDDPAGLSIADQLHASIAALSQSAQNTNLGVGLGQTADGSLAQVTNLLDRAVTIATEAASGGNGGGALTALDSEFQSIKAEIDRIGSATTFNGASVFVTGTTSIFLSDATSSSTIGINIGALSSSGLGIGSHNILTAAAAQSALTNVNAAILTVAQDRGTLGSVLKRLNAAVNVINNQVQNITAAEDSFRAANIPQEVANLAKFSVLNQTGIAALAQADQATQSLLALFR